jgi:hypothetical protein
MFPDSPPAGLKSEAELQRDSGIHRAKEHADSLIRDWTSEAYRSLLYFIELHRGDFTAEDVREFACVPEPPDRRAWGAVLVRAAEAGLIHRVGFKPHRDPKRHKGISSVWRVK